MFTQLRSNWVVLEVELNIPCNSFYLVHLVLSTEMVLYIDMATTCIYIYIFLAFLKEGGRKQFRQLLLLCFLPLRYPIICFYCGY